MQARQRARGGEMTPSSAPAEDENTRRDRIAAANMANPNDKVFGYDPSKTGGVFQIESLNYDNSELLFFGWNKDIARRAPMRIEVRKGNNSNMRIAVVRKMISIIREYESGDFVWQSQRLRRDITLSARLEDTAGLEEVLMREFFDDPRGR